MSVDFLNLNYGCKATHCTVHARGQVNLTKWRTFADLLPDLCSSYCRSNFSPFIRKVQWVLVTFSGSDMLFSFFFQGLLQCTAACLAWWGKATGYGSLLITSLNCTSQLVRACTSESGKIFLVFFSLLQSVSDFSGGVLCLSCFSYWIFSGLLFCPDTFFPAGITTAIHCMPIAMACPRGWRALWWMIVSWHTSFFR